MSVPSNSSSTHRDICLQPPDPDLQTMNQPCLDPKPKLPLHVIKQPITSLPHQDSLGRLPANISMRGGRGFAIFNPMQPKYHHLISGLIALFVLANALLFIISNPASFDGFPLTA